MEKKEEVLLTKNSLSIKTITKQRDYWLQNGCKIKNRESLEYQRIYVFFNYSHSTVAGGLEAISTHDAVDMGYFVYDTYRDFLQDFPWDTGKSAVIPSIEVTARIPTV